MSLVAELARLGRVAVRSAVLDARAGGLVAHIELRGRLETVRVRCPPEDALTLTAGLGVPLYATDAAFGAAAPGAPPREAIPGRVRT